MKKKINWMAVMANVLLAVMFAVGLQMTVGVPMAVTVPSVMAMGLLLQFAPGTLAEGLQKEIWKSQLIKTLHRPTDFWMDGEDWSVDVENDKINFAIEGATPGSETNRTTYPIPVEELGETPGSVELDEFSTNTTVVKDAEVVELSYNKMETVVSRHRTKIRTDYGVRGFWGITPNAETADTPFMPSTGATRNASGFKSLMEDDILHLSEEADSLDWGVEGRVLRLTDEMYWDLKNNSTTFQKQLELMAAGKIGAELISIHGWNIKRIPNYVRSFVADNAGTLERTAFGITPVSGTHHPVSLAYLAKDSFVYCNGTTEMYGEDKVTSYQGNLINFRHRGLVRLKQQARMMALFNPTV